MKQRNIVMCLLQIACVLNAVAYGREETKIMPDEISEEVNSLKTENEIIKLRLEIMELKMDKQDHRITKVESKSQSIDEYFVKIERTLASLVNQEPRDSTVTKSMFMYAPLGSSSGHDKGRTDKAQSSGQNFNITSNLLQRIQSKETQNTNIISKQPQLDPVEPRADLMTYLNGKCNILQAANISHQQGTDKAQMAGHDLKTTVNMLQDRVSQIESTISKLTQLDPDLMMNLSGQERPMLCIPDAEKNLVRSDGTLPTSCSTSNSANCVNNKCRIQNHLFGPESFSVSCDATTDGGDWTIIQRRIDDSVDFDRDWYDYKHGFGCLDDNYWMGLDKLYALTNTLAPVELRIQLEDFENVTKYATYDAFAVDDESTGYILKNLGGYSGTAGDALSRHKGHMFATKDRMDKDNCAQSRHGAWWFDNCMDSNLNGRYYNMSAEDYGIYWYQFRGDLYSLKFAQMMIRPKFI